MAVGRVDFTKISDKQVKFVQRRGAAHPSGSEGMGRIGASPIASVTKLDQECCNAGVERGSAEKPAEKSVQQIHFVCDTGLEPASVRSLSGGVGALRVAFFYMPMEKRGEHTGQGRGHGDRVQVNDHGDDLAHPG